MNTTQSSETSLPRPSRLLLRLVFWSGVVLLFYCRIASSPTGDAQRFFILPGCLLLAGLFVPRWRYRIASVALIALCIAHLVQGHRASIEFQHFLEQQALTHLTP
ncbi:MAG: hypothetical protein K9N47_07600 [Prosthecobacter sp.]|uniref:hypothetical protein n=1 Tax=Prosthecobacter sp. TaxID=1965333 RepID=UPI0025E1F46B|nr:hypothetical protein [Prosthecobacter sp.]MCF7785971.1 hypothetical protein [Prosthecobacter sp.]